MIGRGNQLGEIASPAKWQAARDKRVVRSKT
jgi:hypothetical protein